MKKNTGLKFSYAISLATQLGFVTMASIGGFLMLGMWLDEKMNTSPIMLIIGIIVGISVTIYEAHHLIKPLITPDKDNHD